MELWLSSGAKEHEHTTASHSNATEHVKWQVRFASGWQDLPTEASCKIEAARNAGEHTVEYKQCRNKKKHWWDSYVIDFKESLQTNTRSGTTRATRRKLVELAAPCEREDTDPDSPLQGIWKDPENIGDES